MNMELLFLNQAKVTFFTTLQVTKRYISLICYIISAQIQVLKKGKKESSEQWKENDRVDSGRDRVILTQFFH